MKQIFFTLLITLFAVAGYSQKQAGQSAWAPENIKVDGITNEWTQPFPFMDKRGKFEYFISNDQDNLYVIIRAFDPMLHQKIMRAGMEVQLTTKIKKRLKATVVYPLTRPARQGNQVAQRADPSVLRQNFMAANRQMRVSGLQSRKGLVSNTGIEGLSAVIDWESNFIMGYELSVPLKEFYGEAYDIEDALNNPIDVRITFKAMTQPQGGRPGGSSGGRSGGRGGGRTGGGAPGGGGRMGGGAQQGGAQSEMFSAITSKTKIILSREK